MSCSLPLFRKAASLPAVGLLLCSVGVLACSRGENCLGSGPSTVSKYEDCQRLCAQGNQEACDRQSRVETDLHQACGLRSNKEACRALCKGSKKFQNACQRLRDLP